MLACCCLDVWKVTQLSPPLSFSSHRRRLLTSGLITGGGGGRDAQQRVVCSAQIELFVVREQIKREVGVRMKYDTARTIREGRWRLGLFLSAFCSVQSWGSYHSSACICSHWGRAEQTPGVELPTSASVMHRVEQNFQRKYCQPDSLKLSTHVRTKQRSCLIGPSHCSARERTLRRNLYFHLEDDLRTNTESQVCCVF